MAETPRRNDHADFVGCPEIVRRQAETLALFRAAAGAQDWASIHDGHYDWWMFPIDQPSSHGYAWTVYPDEIDDLAATAGFLDDYLDGARILLLSWGWEVASRRLVDDPAPDQDWQDWPIRLEKCGRSLWLFSQQGLAAAGEAYGSVREYATLLMARGVNMHYRDRNVWHFFRDHH
ncbi:MAG: opioid growth factor receptor-related protein [Candidatus Nanopelagicales bacterium]